MYSYTIHFIYHFIVDYVLLLVLKFPNDSRISYKLLIVQWTSLACTFCFPFSDQVKFPRKFLFSFYISYVYICMCRR